MSISQPFKTLPVCVGCVGCVCIATKNMHEPNSAAHMRSFFSHPLTDSVLNFGAKVKVKKALRPIELVEISPVAVSRDYPILLCDVQSRYMSQSVERHENRCLAP